MDNSISILTSIDSTVKSIASVLAPKNSAQKTADAIRGLHQGGINQPPKQAGDTVGINGKVDKNTMEFLKSIPDIVKGVAKVKITDIIKFKFAINHIMSALETVSEKSKKISGTNSKAVKDVIKSLEDIDKAMKNLSKSVKYIPMALLAVKGMTAVFGAYAKMLQKLGGITSARVLMLNAVIRSFRKVTISMMLLSAGLVGMVLALVAVGALAVLAWKPILIGVGVLVGMVGLIVGLCFLMKITSTTVLPIGASAIMDYALFLGLCAGLVIVSVLTGLLVIALWPAFLVGIATIVAVAFGITQLAVFMAKKGVEMKALNVGVISGIKDMTITLMASAAVVILAAVAGAVAIKYWKQVLVGLGAMVAVISACIGLAYFISNTLTGFTKRYLTAIDGLRKLQIVLLLSAAVVLAAVGLGKVLSKSNAGATAIAFVVMGSIIMGAVGILKLLSKVKVDMKSIGALALIEVLIAGSILVAMQVVRLAKEIAAAPKGSILGALALMLGLIVGVGAIVTAAGLLVTGPQAAMFTAGAIALGVILLAVAGIIAIAIEITKLIQNIANAKAMIDEVGGETEVKNFVKNGIGGIMREVNMENFDPQITVFQAMKLALKYSAISKLAKGIIDVAGAIAALASIGASIDDSGKFHRVIGKDSDGNVLYDKTGVDIVATSRMMSKALFTFVENSQIGFKEAAKFVRAADCYETIGTIIDPISKFAEIVTAYDVSEDGSRMRRVELDEEGNIKQKEYVDVVGVATAIANSFSMFVRTVFDANNMQEWMNLISGQGRKKRKQAERTSNILATIVDPISQFVEMVTAFNVTPDGKIGKLEFNEDGTVKTTTMVDTGAIARNIVSTFSTFVRGVYNSELLEMISDAEDVDMSAVMNPINGYMDSIKKLSMDQGLDPARIDSLSRSVDSWMKTIEGHMDKKHDKMRKNFSVSMKSASSSLNSFDDVLLKNAKSRKRKLDDLSDAVKTLSERVSKSATAFSNMQKAIREINNLDESKIDKLNSFVNSDGPKKIEKAAKGTNALAGGITKTDIIDGVRIALDGAYLGAEKRTRVGKKDPSINGYVIDMSSATGDTLDNIVYKQ